MSVRVLVLENDRMLVLENDHFLVLENDRHPVVKGRVWQSSMEHHHLLER
jgi:hypothetical protein